MENSTKKNIAIGVGVILLLLLIVVAIRRRKARKLKNVPGVIVTADVREIMAQDAEAQGQYKDGGDIFTTGKPPLPTGAMGLKPDVVNKQSYFTGVSTVYYNGDRFTPGQLKDVYEKRLSEITPTGGTPRPEDKTNAHNFLVDWLRAQGGLMNNVIPMY